MATFCGQPALRAECHCSSSPPVRGCVVSLGLGASWRPPARRDDDHGEASRVVGGDGASDRLRARADGRRGSRGALAPGRVVRDVIGARVSRLLERGRLLVPRRGGCARARAALAAALAAQGAADAGAMLVFDRAVKAAQRDRAAWLRRTHPSGDASDPFLEEVTRRTLDRLHDVKREFPRVLVLGGAGDQVTRRLLRDRPDVRAVVVVDASRDMLALARRRVGDEACIDDPNPSSLDSQTVRNAAGHDVRVHYVHADEEALPLRDESVDAAVSVLGLHWANDLPGAMSQARKALTPDGLFLSAVLGGETLREMRIACAVAELEREGGVSQRVSPLAQVRDCGNLLTRAGMRLPAVDVDTLTMQYPDPMKLVEHLRIMGETNAALSRRAGPIARTTAAAAALYRAARAEGGPPPELAPENGDARARGVECTFQVMYMTGWSPGEGQQQAAERGSAGVSLAKLEEELAKIPKK